MELHAHIFLTTVFASSYRSYVFLHAQSTLACILQSLVKTYLCSLVYIGMTAALSFPLVGLCPLLLGFCLGPDSHPSHEIILPMKGIFVLLNIHLSLLSFRFCSLYIHCTFFSISSWSLPGLSNSTIKMSSAMPMTLGIQLNRLSIFFWNTSAAGACSKW